MLRKRMIACLICLALVGGLLFGCGDSTLEVTSGLTVDDHDEDGDSEEETPATNEAQDETTDDTEADPGSVNGFPMDPTVMKPWLNSTVKGMVTDDVNADAKDDFYLNVNHDWLRDTEFKHGMPFEMEMFQALDIVKERCMSILADKSLLKSDDAEIARDAYLIQGIYELYLDWDARNEAGIKPFEPVVEKIISIDSVSEMTDFLLSDDNFLWGTFPAVIVLNTSETDTSRYKVDILPTTLLAYDDAANYRDEDAEINAERKYDEDVFKYMSGRFGIDDAEAQRYLADAYAFEKQIASAEKTNLERNDTSYDTDSINPVSMEDLEKLSHDFPLADYMEQYGYAESKLINLRQPEWLSALGELYTEEHLDEIKAYVLKYTLRNIIKFADEDAFREWQKLDNAMKGVEEGDSEEALAYQYAKDSFPDSFGRIYVDEYLSEEMKQEITQICQDCIDTYREILADEDWLSDDMKEKAINKLNHIRIDAVYPDKWEDYSVYDIKSKEDGGTYADAVASRKKGKRALDISHVNANTDKDIWGVDILNLNAYYTPTKNTVTILPGYFCDVTYRSDMDIEEKYGAFCTTVGHEISHAFDPHGGQYDENGNVSDWWTEADKKAFQERIDKLIAWYDNVVAYDNGSKYEGRMVQGEAVADMGGMKCTLKMAEKIDGFDYDKFFRAYAKAFTRLYTPEVAYPFTSADTHPIEYIRVNATVQQFDEFIDTYGVKEGDGMYLAPSDRILVW